MDTTTDFEIIPYIGAGILRFGMTSYEVKNLLGSPDLISQSYLKSRIEYRSFMNIAYTKEPNEILNHIGFGRQMTGVRVGSILLFQEYSLTVLQKLTIKDSKSFIYNDSIIFMNLGIDLTGFLDEDEDDKAMRVFPQGAWNHLISKLEPFHL